MPITHAIPVPGESTDAPPGSEWKIAVLAERAARGEPLFHPRDNAETLVSQPSHDGASIRQRGLPRGVSRHGTQFLARFQLGGKSRYLGLYPTPEAAANALEIARLTATVEDGEEELKIERG